MMITQIKFFFREIHIENTVVNNFEARSSKRIKHTTTNDIMSYENMPRIQTDRFETQTPTIIETYVIPEVLKTTTKVIIIS